MGKTKGPYNLEFPVGSRVQIASKEVLEDFLKSWKYHNKLQPEQIGYSGQTARVKNAGVYHGGDELYELDGIPGIWHEQCLTPVTNADETP